MDFGIDPGKHRIAVSCPELGLARAYKVPKSTRAREVHLLAHWVGLVVPPGSRVYVEAAILGASGNAQTCIALAETIGGVYSVLGADCEVDRLAPSSWKKIVCGHGSLDKAQVSDWLELNHPALSQACEGDQDRVDATCLGLAWRACEELAGPGDVPRSTAGDLLRPIRHAPDVDAGSEVRPTAVQRLPGDRALSGDRPARRRAVGRVGRHDSPGA